MLKSNFEFTTKEGFRALVSEYAQLFDTQFEMEYGADEYKAIQARMSEIKNIIGLDDTCSLLMNANNRYMAEYKTEAETVVQVYRFSNLFGNEIDVRIDYKYSKGFKHLKRRVQRDSEGNFYIKAINTKFLLGDLFSEIYADEWEENRATEKRRKQYR